MEKVLIDTDVILDFFFDRQPEDALQNFSAQHEAGIQTIITRNVKDYRTSSLSVMTPESFLKRMKYAGRRST